MKFSPVIEPLKKRCESVDPDNRDHLIKAKMMSYEKEDQVLFEWFRTLLNDSILDKHKLSEKADQTMMDILWGSLSREQCKKRRVRRLGKERVVYGWPHTSLKLVNINQ